MKKRLIVLGTGGLLLFGVAPSLAFLPSAGSLLENVNVNVGGRSINLAPVGGLIDDTIAGGGSFLSNLGNTIRGVLVEQNPCITTSIAGGPTQFCPFTDEEIAGLLGPLGLPDTAALENRAVIILQEELGAAAGDRRSGGAFGLNPAHQSMFEARQENQLAIQAVVNSRLSGMGQEEVMEMGEQIEQVTVNSLNASAAAQGQVITQEVLKSISEQLGQGAIADYQIYNQLAANGSTALYSMGLLNDLRGHMNREEEERVVQTGIALTQTFQDYSTFAATLLR